MIIKNLNNYMVYAQRPDEYEAVYNIFLRIYRSREAP